MLIELECRPVLYIATEWNLRLSPLSSLQRICISKQLCIFKKLEQNLTLRIFLRIKSLANQGMRSVKCFLWACNIVGFGKFSNRYLQSQKRITMIIAHS